MEPFVNFRTRLLFCFHLRLYSPNVLFSSEAARRICHPKLKKKHVEHVADAPRDAISNDPSSLLLFLPTISRSINEKFEKNAHHTTLPFFFLCQFPDPLPFLAIAVVLLRPSRLSHCLLLSAMRRYQLCWEEKNLSLCFF